MRFLILLAGIVVLILTLRGLLLPPPRRNARDTRQEPEKMVGCAKCGLYLPESEALSAEGRFFCNLEHHHGWLADQRGKKI
ncbi:MAG TPA: PP0621 family protein [Gammaproteobacteria bacterium]|nr:PP0621 family protein [Gammaproteobacteria bacterium]